MIKNLISVMSITYNLKIHRKHCKCSFFGVTTYVPQLNLAMFLF